MTRTNREIGNQAVFSNTGAMPQRTSKDDRALFAVALIDHAVQTLFQLGDLSRAPRPPRSLLFEFVHLDQRFASNERFTSQVALLLSAGQNVTRLGQKWKQTISSSQAQTLQRYYQVASLAVTSIAMAWLLVRKRRV